MPHFTNIAVFFNIVQKGGGGHPVARAAQMLGEEHFATSWI